MAEPESDLGRTAGLPPPETSGDALRALATLAESEERFRQLAENIGGAFFMDEILPDGGERLLYVSPGYERIWGREAAELYRDGRAWFAAVHPADRAAVTAALGARSEGRLDVEYRIVRPDGQVRWVHDRTFPVYDETGTVFRIAGLAEDVTERRLVEQAVQETNRELQAANEELQAVEEELRRRNAEAEAARRRSELLAEASSILGSSLDYEQTLAAIGRLAVPRLADYCLIFEVDGAGGLRPLTALHADPAKQPLLDSAVELYRAILTNPASLLARALTTQRPELVADVPTSPVLAAIEEAELRASLAERAPRSALILPLALRGQTLGLLLLVTTADSARAYGERDLTMGAELARRIAMALDNARLYREAQAANAAKDRFLATLSHELRTPLTPVLALASALAEDERLPDDARASLGRVRRNVELEARLIDDLLDLTRIARGKLELHREVTDLAGLIDQALLTCCSEAVAAGRIAVSSDLAAGDHRVWADPPRLTQVLWNLFSNAVKFTRPPDQTPRAPARIVVRSWSEEGPEDTAWVAVEVTDQGIGIDAEALPRIFDGFEQGERSITRRFGGLGLGLAVSQAIAELHGGTLTAASAGPGQGATFTLRLPRGAIAERTSAPASAAAESGEAADGIATGGIAAGQPTGAGLHILLIEDHADTATAMAELLRAGGHRVTVADGVASGLAAAAAAAAASGEAAAPGAVDLVLSDLGLPDGSGLDLMRELAGRYGLRGIALSGYGMDEDVRKSREAGFRRHLTKPVTIQRLRAAITEAIEATEATEPVAPAKGSG